MHTKIHKSTRHKKLKAIDPYYKGERKQFIDKKAKNANEKPKDANIQEIPRKLRELMKATDLMKEGRPSKSSQKKKQKELYNEGDDYGPGVKGCDRKPQTIPVFKQKSKESDELFSIRVEKMTEDIIAGSKIEAKFGNDFDWDVNESDGEEADVPDIKKSGVKKPKTNRKLAKRKVFQDEEKEKKRLKMEERHLDQEENLTDYIPFGEVVLQPPTLSFAPRKVVKQNPAERKPGAKPLILSKFFDSAKSTNQSDDQTSKKQDLTVKRKLLSNAERRILERERETAVLAYRQLKKKQQVI